MQSFRDEIQKNVEIGAESFSHPTLEKCEIVGFYEEVFWPRRLILYAKSNTSLGSSGYNSNG